MGHFTPLVYYTLIWESLPMHGDFTPSPLSVYIGVKSHKLTSN